MKCIFIFAAALAASVLPTGATLKWEKLEFRARCSPLDQQVLASFPFTNLGPRTVTVKWIRSTCGCTVVTLTNTVIKPNESGVITAVFTLEHRTGVQKKPITVETDDTAQPRIGLYVVADIPEVISVKPIYLLWQPDEKPESKRIVVQPDPTYDVESITATAFDANLAVSVEPMTNGTYNISVTPKTEKGVIASVLQVDALLKGGHRKTTDVYVRVR